MPIVPVLALLAVLLGPGAARAADLREIVLDDGSTIVAEVRSLSGGVYRLQSPSLGAIEIAQQRVRRIGPPSSATPPEPGASGAEVQALKQQLVGDPASASALVGLSELPEMQEVLADPDILRAVETGDLDALANHPKIQRLMSHPSLQELTRTVAPAP